MGRRVSVKPYGQTRGFTLIELLLSVAMAALLIAGTAGLLTRISAVQQVTRERNAMAREARFAMERMVRAMQRSRLLLVPQPDKTFSDWREHVREQTVPPSPPEGSSALATAALAMLQDPAVDLDSNGFPDVDNDRDGRIDEDLYRDMNRDGVAGIRGIDDGGDGFFDNVNWWDDDETNGVGDEDPVNNFDDDADAMVDEDSSGDMNGDGAPGFAGVDDDGDGLIDEGNFLDDDEDGQVDEDWLDTVTYYLQGGTLIERIPVPWDITGNGSVTGWDFVESPIAENVTRFRVERIPETAGRYVLVDVTLEISGTLGDPVSLNTRVRLGGAL